MGRHPASSKHPSSLLQASAAWTPKRGRRSCTTWKVSSTRRSSLVSRAALTITPSQVSFTGEKDRQILGTGREGGRRKIGQRVPARFLRAQGKKMLENMGFIPTTGGPFLVARMLSNPCLAWPFPQGCCCTEALLNPSSILGTGIAVALKQAMTPEFKTYQQQVVANCKALSAALTSLGYHVVTGKKITLSGTISTPFLSK